MKSINSLLIIALLFVGNVTGFSQSTKVDSKTMNKAVKKTDKLASQITNENPDLALSESQKEQIIALQIEQMNEVKALRKSNANKDEIKTKSKALSKAMNAKIKNEILTPEQAKAQKAARKKRKAEKGNGKKVKKEKGKKAKKEKGKKAKKEKGKKAKKGNKGSTMTASEVDAIYATATAKQKARAEKATEKLNAKIIASDANLALSPDQIKQINALNIKGLLERAKMEKAGATKEEVKEVVKANKRAIKSILTKEQKNTQKKKKSE